MKNLKTIAIALLMAVSTIASAQMKKVDASKSSISWIGKKVTGQHSGTINLKEGNLNFKGKKLTGGSFVVNMTSLNTTDLSGEYQEKLNGHLKDDDFFGLLLQNKIETKVYTPRVLTNTPKQINTTTLPHRHPPPHSLDVYVYVTNTRETKYNI